MRGSENGNRHSPTGREILTGVTRTMIDVTNPLPSDLFLVDIASSLAHQERFTGHCWLRPTVAQHSLAVEHIAGLLMPDEVGGDRTAFELGLRRAALMHDATEMVVSDVNGAVKKAMRAGFMDGVSAFDLLEQRAEAAIAERFDCANLPDYEGIVHEADCLACSYEMQWGGWCPEAKPPAWVVVSPYISRCYQTHDCGANAFLRRARALGLTER